MAGEKPFEPTPARLARARRDGDRPRSRDLVAVASFAFASAALACAIRVLGPAAARALRDAAHLRPAPGPYLALAACAVAVIASAAAGGALATAAQGGIAFRPPGFDLAKTNPVPGLRRMFGADAFAGAAKAFVVALGVTCAVVPAASGAFGGSVTVAGTGALAALAMRGVLSAIVAATCVATLFAGVDALLERAKWRRRLRMSFDELKRDHKASEGDPHLRGRRRAAHRDLVRGSIGAVREAAFVVANPTHVAIALAYRPPAVPVPCVVVRAIDDGALAVKERARTLGIPIVADVALARRLLASTAVGDPIPRDVYGAVATIVAALLREKALA